jgi:inward rectifier potassium channel
MGALRSRAKRKKSQRVVVGHRAIETLGLHDNFWTDLFHRSMTISWPVFFVSAACIFLLLNSVFAVLYFLGDQPVANAENGRFVDLFFFSIETLATVGYGDMHPRTVYGHVIATAEIFTGMSLLAVMTGLVFARFSRPRARFVFAEHPVVATYEGRPTLMIRIANARHNTIAGATARLWLVREEKSAEGQAYRRYYELTLHRNENPIFVLSWTLFHTIDESSPLFGATPDDLARADAVLMLTVVGIDQDSAQRLNAQKLYSHEDIRWQHRYVDILTNTADGRALLDYGKFHHTQPDGP